MARIQKSKKRSKLKPERREYRPLFLKQWLCYRNKSQEQLASALEMSRVQVNRISNGRRQYTQDFLEAAAEYLETDPASLIMRDPSKQDAIWSLWDIASEGERRDIVRLAEVVLKRKQG